MMGVEQKPDEIEKLFKISSQYKEKSKRVGMQNDGRRMSPLIRSVYEQAVRAYHQKKYREASVLFTSVLDQGERSSVAAYFGGNAFFRIGAYPAAKKCLEKVVEFRENYYHLMYAYTFLAYFAIREKDFRAAIALLKIPISNEFESALPYSFMGYIAHKQKKYSLSEKYYKEALSRDPENPSFENNLGFTYVEWKQQLPRAEELITAAVRKEQKNPAYLHSWGWLFFVNNKLQKAFLVLTKAFKIARFAVIKRDLDIIRDKMKDEKENIV